MTISNGYLTLAKFKTLANIQGTDANRDLELDATIEAVSRLIDEHCHRRFYTTTNDETRYYTATKTDEFECPDDIISITTLATDLDGSRGYTDTWAATDYDLLPFNAILDGVPYTRLELANFGTKVFPLYPRGVKIVGKFGYAATIPELVARACFIQAFRLWMRKAAPFGVAGGGDMGQAVVIPTLDPDIVLLLSKVARL